LKNNHLDPPLSNPGDGHRYGGIVKPQSEEKEE